MRNEKLVAVAEGSGSRQKAKVSGRCNCLKFKVQSLRLIRGKATALK
jgi:hypothetical protein